MTALARLHLIPRERRFFELLSQAAENTLEGAEVLVEILEHCDDHARLGRRLEDIEHAGDELTHQIQDRLNRTFVTPLDREDISGLASGIDDVIDWANLAGRRIHLNQIVECTALARQLGRVILEQAEQIARAVPLLDQRRVADALERHIREIHRLENEGDDLLAEAIAHLFDGVTTVPGVIQGKYWENIYEVLEDTTDKAEHVAVVLHNIAMKNG